MQWECMKIARAKTYYEGTSNFTVAFADDMNSLSSIESSSDQQFMSSLNKTVLKKSLRAWEEDRVGAC